MAKWEKDEINAEILAVQFDVDLKKQDGSTYKGARVMYTAFDKPNTKSIPQSQLDKNVDLKAQLSTCNPGDSVTVYRYRMEGAKLWNWSEVKKGHMAQRSQAPRQETQQEQATSQGGFNPNPAAVGQALNLAIELGLAKNYKQLLDPSVAREAIDKYKQAKDLYAELWDAPVAKTNTQQQEEIEEEIPF